MTSGPSSPLSTVLEIIHILDDLGIRYHVGGSFASAVHGVPRQTMDADLVVDLHVSQIDALTARLQPDFYIDADVVSEAVRRRSSFNTIHFASGFKIDFFVKGTSEFDELELERSVLTEIVSDPPQSAWIKSAEDTVLRKLEWYRSGGEVSDRQWRDILGILMTVGDSMDREYLVTWAHRLDVDDLLERAWRQVGTG